MMGRRRGLPLFIALAAVQLAGCSYVKSWFPDKEKDYQYTTEIPELIVPPELTDQPGPAASDAASGEAAEAEAAGAAGENGVPAADGQSAEDLGKAADRAVPTGGLEESLSGLFEKSRPEKQPETAEPVPAESGSPGGGDSAGAAAESSEPVRETERDESGKPAKITADLIVYNDGETRLKINAEKATAWRVVGKSLSRKSIEVIERDQEAGSYQVQYDPEEKQFVDESFWDEIKFVFGGLKANEKQYVLMLIENNRQTDVAILDQDGKPTSDPAGLKLLKVIQKTINADQAEQNK